MQSIAAQVLRLENWMRTRGILILTTRMSAGSNAWHCVAGIRTKACGRSIIARLPVSIRY